MELVSRAASLVLWGVRRCPPFDGLAAGSMPTEREGASCRQCGLTGRQLLPTVGVAPIACFEIIRVKVKSRFVWVWVLPPHGSVGFYAEKPYSLGPLGVRRPTASPGPRKPAESIESNATRDLNLVPKNMGSHRPGGRRTRGATRLDPSRSRRRTCRLQFINMARAAFERRARRAKSPAGAGTISTSLPMRGTGDNSSNSARQVARRLWEPMNRI